jgi:large subunit ribosomal protein L32
VPGAGKAGLARHICGRERKKEKEILTLVASSSVSKVYFGRNVMPNPKRRHSKTRGRKRRTHDSLKPAGLSACANCQRLRMSHRVCPYCGYYDGRFVEGIVKTD